MTLGANPDPTNYADPSPDRKGGENHTRARDQNRARQEAENHTRARDQSRARQEAENHTRASEEADNVTKSSGQRPLPHGRGSESPGDSERPGGSEMPGGSDALGYLITFTTYGTWLHGDKRGSVDRDHNTPGTPHVDPNALRLQHEADLLKHPPVLLSADRRAVVHRTIVDVCEHHDWTLHTFNVRSNHVHVVVSAPESPERVMNDFKSWATRGLVAAGLIHRGTVVWTRHGSTRYLWKPQHMVAACQYVSEHQGTDLDQHS